MGEKTTRHTIRCPAQPLIEYQKRTGFSWAEIAGALGATVGGVTGWVKKNDMPKTARVALEALERREGRSAKTSTFIALVPPDKNTTFQQLCSALGIRTQVLQLEVK